MGPANLVRTDQEKVAYTELDSAFHLDMITEASPQSRGTTSSPHGEQVPTNGTVQRHMADEVIAATDGGSRNEKHLENLSTVMCKGRNTVAFPLGLPKTPSQILRNSSVMNSVLSRFRSDAASKEANNDVGRIQHQEMDETFHKECSTRASLSMDNVGTHDPGYNGDLSGFDDTESCVQVNTPGILDTYPDLSNSIRISSQLDDLQQKRSTPKKVPALDFTGIGPDQERADSEQILKTFETTTELDDFPTTRRSSACLPSHAAEQSPLSNDVSPNTWDLRSMSSATEDEAGCAQCRARGVHISFCVACSTTCDAAFCDSCWSSQIAHRSEDQTSANAIHKKLNAEEFRLAKEVKNVLNVQPSNMTEELFQQDAKTAWFGKLT